MLLASLRSRARLLRRPGRVLRTGLELAAVLLVLTYASSGLHVTDERVRIRGNEISYLSYSGTVAADMLRLTGRIPLWNPLLGSGEPLVEHPFGFVLNPIMFLPFAAVTNSVQAIKLTVWLHIGLMGVAGWLLAYTLRMRWPARVLLGVLFGSMGSYLGAIGFGFLQMSLSQVYVVLTFAGMFATLYRRERWGVGLLAVGTFLLLAAGTFWYVLPAALGCALLIACALPRLLVRLRRGRLRLDRRRWARLLLASAFVLALGLIRIWPLLAVNAVSDHPPEFFDYRTPFDVVVERYFSPAIPPEPYQIAQQYHYVVPGVFLAALAALRILAIGSPAVRRLRRWRIYLPAVLLVVVFSVWAMVDIPLVRALYEQIGVLSNWRLLDRMQAAGAFWVLVLTGLLFDDVWRYVLSHIRRRAVRPSRRLAAALRQVMATGVALLLLAGGVLAGWDVSNNFQRAAGLEPFVNWLGEPLRIVRALYPGEMLPANTENFWNYESFPRHLVRAAFGNPDYRLRVPSEVGLIEPGRTGYLPARFILDTDSSQAQRFIDAGYIRIAEAVYLNDAAVDYAFSVPQSITDWPSAYVPQRSDTQSLSYFHRIDQVEAMVPAGRTGDAIVVQEAALDGWHARVNGEARAVVSVYGLAGIVVQPDDTFPMHVTFTYAPARYVLSAVLLLAGALALTLYLLRADRLLKPRRQQGMAVEANEALHSGTPHADSA